MLVATQDYNSNMWIIRRQEEAGNIPEELKGKYTSKRVAEQAIARYAEEVIGPRIEASSGALEKALWAKARKIKGMPSRDAFEMLKEQHREEAK